MSPENARVLVVEDDEEWLNAIEEILESSGHRVVLTATTLKKALEVSEGLRDKNIDVAIIDGNLGPYRYDGRDGQIVISAIRKNAPNVKTVGMSGSDVPGTDVDLGKHNLVRLGEVVKKL